MEFHEDFHPAAIKNNINRIDQKWIRLWQYAVIFLWTLIRHKKHTSVIHMFIWHHSYTLWYPPCHAVNFVTIPVFQRNNWNIDSCDSLIILKCPVWWLKLHNLPSLQVYDYVLFDVFFFFLIHSNRKIKQSDPDLALWRLLCWQEDKKSFTTNMKNSICVLTFIYFFLSQNNRYEHTLVISFEKVLGLFKCT